MKNRLDIKHRLFVTAIFTILMIVLLSWDYFNNGVPAHHLLHDENMPAISNWWGLIIIPVSTWFISGRIKYDHINNLKNEHSKIIARGAGLFIFGIIVSYFFTTNPESDIPGYATLGLMLLSFFIPVYKAECFLGYVAGMIFTFGAFIPVFAGIIFWILFYVFYKGPRKLLALSENKSKKVTH